MSIIWFLNCKMFSLVSKSFASALHIISLPTDFEALKSQNVRSGCLPACLEVSTSATETDWSWNLTWNTTKADFPIGCYRYSKSMDWLFWTTYNPPTDGISSSMIVKYSVGYGRLPSSLCLANLPMKKNIQSGNLPMKPAHSAGEN